MYKMREKIFLTEEQRKRLQDELLSICVDIFNFCEENSIVCMLGGGSCLGAVRHKGFIPWDDDVDLLMPRKDYNRFIEQFKQKYIDKYEIFSPYGDNKTINSYSKVSKIGTVLRETVQKEDEITGIYIDIFPLENVPNNLLLRTLRGHVSNIFKFSCVSAVLYENRNRKLSAEYGKKIKFIIHNIQGLFLSFKSYKWWFKKYDSFIQYDKETNYLAIPTGRKAYFGEILPRRVYLPPRKSEFCGKEFFIPNDSDAYLSNLYGKDYMIPPPIDKRESHYFIEVKF